MPQLPTPENSIIGRTSRTWRHRSQETEHEALRWGDSDPCGGCANRPDQYILVMLPTSMTERSRILVVDDDASIRGLLRAVLTRVGYDVDLAAEGGAALVALATTVYRAVILDLMMPGVTGYQVIEELEKESSPHPRCLIILSATSTKNLDALDSPAVHSKITKPFEISKLLAQIGDCIAAQE